MALARRMTALVDFLIDSVKPDVVIVHGKDAAIPLHSKGISAHVTAVPRFSCGWSQSDALALGQRIRRECGATIHSSRTRLAGRLNSGVMRRNVINTEELLARSTELAEALEDFLTLVPYDNSARIISSRTLCGVSFDHAECARILIANGNFTSSLGILRMQYEALVKAVWILYAASENSAGKLISELNHEAAIRADKVPLLSEMLGELEGKAPEQALVPLREFKEYSWKPLSSFIHGGLHAINRHSKGYPFPVLSHAVRSSNGLLILAQMMLVILSGDPRHSGKVSSVQQRFADCLPNLAPSHNTSLHATR